MITNKKRIHNITPYFRHIPEGSKIIFGIIDPLRFSNILKLIGFLEPFQKGQSILPTAVGSISKYNSTGKIIIHRDQPLETAYRQVDWHWQQWDDSWHSRIVDVPYKRYPRTFLKPPAIELSITENKNGQLLLTSPVFKKTDENKEIIKHSVNLFLEIFKECHFFTDNLENIIKTPLRKLNWIILPQGEMPWEQTKKYFDPLITSAKKGNQPLLYYRLEVVNKLKPDFRAYGYGGFYGYIVHGFTKKKIYILESINYGNATYVFGETWEELSKKTKAEILNENLQKARIIHREGWKKNIEQVIKGN